MTSLKTRVNASLKSARLSSEKIHVLLCDLADHAQEHGDTTLLATLINGMATGTGYRATAMITWIAAFSPLDARRDENKQVVFGKPKKIENRRPWLINDARNVPFWEFTVEKEVKPFDAIKALNAISKREDKVIEGEIEAVTHTLAEFDAAVDAARARFVEMSAV